jgi:hypothetical protein
VVGTSNLPQHIYGFEISVFEISMLTVYMIYHLLTSLGRIAVGIHCKL